MTKVKLFVSFLKKIINGYPYGVCYNVTFISINTRKEQ